MVFIATLRIELSSITTRRLHRSTAKMAQRRRWTASETLRRWAGSTGGVDAAGVEESVGAGGDATWVSSVVGDSAIWGAEAVDLRWWEAAQGLLDLRGVLIDQIDVAGNLN